MLITGALIVLFLALVSIILFLVVVISSIQDRLKKSDQRLNQFAQALDVLPNDVRNVAQLAARQVISEHRMELSEMERRAMSRMKEANEVAERVTSTSVAILIELQQFMKQENVSPKKKPDYGPSRLFMPEGAVLEPQRHEAHMRVHESAFQIRQSEDKRGADKEDDPAK